MKEGPPMGKRERERERERKGRDFSMVVCIECYAC